jgi:hypothetical protein
MKVDETELLGLGNELELAAAVTVRLDMELSQRNCIQPDYCSQRDTEFHVVRFELGVGSEV